MLDLEKARKELKEKSYLEIQESTTWTWAARACVAYEKAEKETKLEEKLGWAFVGTEYDHEAIEHAALCEDKGRLTKIIQATTNVYRQRALDSIKELGKKIS